MEALIKDRKHFEKVLHQARYWGASVTDRQEFEVVSRHQILRAYRRLTRLRKLKPVPTEIIAEVIAGLEAWLYYTIEREG